MTESQFANEDGSLLMAAESTQSTSGVNLYEVAVLADVQLSLTGYVQVYAADVDEAVEKVQAQIDNETLDDDLDMEDSDSGNTMPYGNVKYLCNGDFQTDGVELIEDNVDPFDVLEAEVKELEGQISWDADALARQKAFLETLADTQAKAEQLERGAGARIELEVSR